jgi:hypothetical protein
VAFENERRVDVQRVGRVDNLEALLILNINTMKKKEKAHEGVRKTEAKKGGTTATKLWKRTAVRSSHAKSIVKRNIIFKITYKYSGREGEGARGGRQARRVRGHGQESVWERFHQVSDLLETRR